jgi:hypothetical protein
MLGIMEYWSEWENGVMEKWRGLPSTPVFQYSNTPVGT